MPRIIRNAIRCEKCRDIIESKTIHDFKCCSCGACAVDGGHNYLRRCGNLGDWEELSEVEKNGGQWHFGLIPDEMSGLRYQNDAHHRVFHCAEEV